MRHRLARSSRKRRKGLARGEGEVEAAEPESAAEGKQSDAMARGYSRSRAKDDAARAALEPLEPGERPGAVTVGAVVALLLGAGNLAAYFAGMEIQGERPAAFGVFLYSGLMLLTSYGCFRSRYWGVLGIQTVLGLMIVVFGLLMTRAESILALVISVAVVGLSGTLFWKLVKSMARIQMPRPPGAMD